MFRPGPNNGYWTEASSGIGDLTLNRDIDGTRRNAGRSDVIDGRSFKTIRIYDDNSCAGVPFIFRLSRPEITITIAGSRIAQMKVPVIKYYRGYCFTFCRVSNSNEQTIAFYVETSEIFFFEHSDYIFRTIPVDVRSTY